MSSKQWIQSLSFFALAALVCTGCQPTRTYDEIGLPEVVDFNFHIKPILSDRCFQCHGPDANTREADLRLDEPSSAIETRLESGGRAIVPGRVGKSKLYQRITSGDPQHVMPPPESNLSLSPHEIALLAKWIDQGAEYKPHWSFLPVQEAVPPSIDQEAWTQNPIDHFVLASMERQGLQPEPEANKETLLRRVCQSRQGLQGQGRQCRGHR